MAADNGINAAENRIVGLMFGSAIGDAVGLYTEFCNQDEAKDSYPDGRFNLDSTGQNLTNYLPDTHRAKFDDGSWTDDTDMALCILLAFLNTGSVDHVSIATRFHSWRQNGLRALDTVAADYGDQTNRVLSRKDYLKFDKGGPQASASAYWIERCGSGRSGGAGNGAIMRTHPVAAICANQTLHQTFTAAAEIARLTHVDPRCVVSAVIATAIARGLIRGEIRTMQKLDQYMQVTLRWYVDQRHAEETDHYQLNNDRRAELSRAVTAESLAELDLDNPVEMGYTYKTLGAAVYCLRAAMRCLSQPGLSRQAVEDTRKSLFEDLISELTMAAGDADTNAAVAGALLGAYLGYDAIPAHWKTGLRSGNFLLSKSRSLCMALRVIPGNYTFGSEEDTALSGGRPVLDKKAANMRRAEFSRWKRRRLDILEERWSSR
ncbi:hypothetical protein VM1G_07402 [Cytospora mali]|uniref:ADP-ribosyl-[dinitrogen reductase] glycohydrolase n=1 Tax=Cytospora mali TaxID=578113 RepID=A0A194W5E5_CYTMA|nr:hypothetical protein VM1G_07402 [Valsa mali]